MNTFITKIKTAVSTFVLFAASCVIAGFGFAMIALLAVFAFLAMGVALLAAPFIGFPAPQDEPVEDAEIVA